MADATVITVSDSCARGEREDVSGPEACRLLREAGFDVEAPRVVPDDRPAIELNAATMARFRPDMRKYYYDPTRYRTYLEQLGIAYPTVRKP